MSSAPTHISASYSQALRSSETSSSAVNKEINAPSLRCVSKPKTIFLSGFEPEVTTDEIMNYIAFHWKISAKLNIRKMSFRQPRSYSSFTIDVGRDQDLFAKLCDQSLWPDNAIVRDYDFFRKGRTQTFPNPSVNLEKYHQE